MDTDKIITDFLTNIYKENIENEIFMYDLEGEKDGNYKINFKSPLEKIFYICFQELKKDEYYKLFGQCNFHYQYPIKGYYVDFVFGFGKYKIAIEIDGFAFHDRNKEEFYKARKRQNELMPHFEKYFVYTYKDIKNNLGDIFSIIQGELVGCNYKEWQENGNKDGKEAN